MTDTTTVKSQCFKTRQELQLVDNLSFRMKRTVTVTVSQKIVWRDPKKCHGVPKNSIKKYTTQQTREMHHSNLHSIHLPSPRPRSTTPTQTWSITALKVSTTSIVRQLLSLLGFWLVKLSTALNLVHRNSFPKLANFPSYFTQLCNFPRGGNFKKHADPEKKNRNCRKLRANNRNLL